MKKETIKIPSTPFPIDGRVYDTDGTTALTGIAVICRNTTNNESMSTTTDSNGDFMFDAVNFTSGYSIGDEISLFTSYGNYYKEYIFTISGAGKTQNLTLVTEITSSSIYCSVTDVRRFTAVDSSEFSDDAVYAMIQNVTNRIDETTGRTWKGIQTVTDEYYDGDDTDLLWLNNIDLRSVTSVAIDDNLDGTYTSITIAKVHLYEEGYITLDRNAEITVFVVGPKTIKVSYIYGVSKPTETVRELAIMMVANQMHLDLQRKEVIDRTFEKVRWLGPRGLA
jgi:hypothetical protein